MGLLRYILIKDLKFSYKKIKYTHYTDENLLNKKRKEFSDEFKKIYKLESKKLIIRYIPVPEVRRYVVVDTDIFTLILGGKKEDLTGFNSIVKIPTSWGASHICMIGDIIIIEKNGIYRVQKDVFELTYSNIFLK